MAEVTDTTLITRIKEILGLRGRVITSSRNSVYPVVVANPYNRPLPTYSIIPPMTEKGARKRMEISQARVGGATTTEYTCPAGKRAFLFLSFQSCGNATYTQLRVVRASLGSTITNILQQVNGVTTGTQLYTPVITLEAGDYIQSSCGAGAAGSQFNVMGWEEDA